MKQAAAFIAGLAEALAREPAREKFLVAPTLRLGRQWLDQAAIIAGGAICRLITPKRLELDLAEPVLRRRGLKPPTRPEKIRLVGLALGRLRRQASPGGYFSRLPASLPLAETLLDALEELEGAGLGNRDSLGQSVKPRAKARELAALLDNFRADLSRARLAGPGEIAAAAREALREGARPAPILILPPAIRESLSPNLGVLLEAWPEEGIISLADEGGETEAVTAFFTADGVANEAREVFRRIQALDLPLDRVEAVCLDPAAYVPALCSAGLEIYGGRLEDLPLTASGGLPADSSRPARRLLAWLDWLENGLQPGILADLLVSGLLGADGPDPSGFPLFRLAGIIRGLPLAGDPADYRRRLKPAAGSDSTGAPAAALAWLRELLDSILPLSSPGGGLELDHPGRILRAARNLLELPDPEAGKLDAYACRLLREEIDLWLPQADWPGFNARAWLAETARGLKVMGLGPMPGRLHVSGLSDGGYAGRNCTFVLGLDDSRFPGSSRENPVLLDRERRKLSPRLVRAGQAAKRREELLFRLAGRARGRLFFSRAEHGSGTGGELFPAAVWEGLRPGPVPAAGNGVVLRPETAEKCLTSRDDWLFCLLAEPGKRFTPADLESWFPHLARGGKALTARASPRFGEYDGLVPEAGIDFFAAAGTLSPSDLERLAACPLDFFFRNILGIASPERYRPEPGQWLAGNVRGSLLHQVFRDFVEKTREEAPDETGWKPLLERILAAEIAREKKRNPVSDPLVAAREENRLREACEIFLAHELELRRSGRPLWLELPLGKPWDNVPPWDRAGDVVLEPAPGRRLRLVGRLDRVDRLEDGELRILDYKTGRSREFPRSDPLRAGRHLQPYLYAEMLESGLAALGQPGKVKEFSYFFPMPRDEGKIVTYLAADLSGAGGRIMAALLELIGNGCFPFTGDKDDAKYSPYLAVYGDVEELAKQAGDKARADPLLGTWAGLRGMGNG
ncbi:MAG: PD-(D/E)XK nuclease family protein [Planctomycetota bacterium]|jgi:hypothetical protein|nr:PD-(D/E)XK nuclease family protein [Planctomycetota bacterium]